MVVNPIISTAKAKGIHAEVIGKVGGDRLKAVGGFDLALSDLRTANEA